jgi:hypothetical protein
LTSFAGKSRCPHEWKHRRLSKSPSDCDSLGTKLQIQVAVNALDSRVVEMPSWSAVAPFTSPHIRGLATPNVWTRHYTQSREIYNANEQPDPRYGASSRLISRELQVLSASPRARTMWSSRRPQKLHSPPVQLLLHCKLAFNLDCSTPSFFKSRSLPSGRPLFTPSHLHSVSIPAVPTPVSRVFLACFACLVSVYKEGSSCKDQHYVQLRWR